MKHILLVEDDNVTRDVVSDFLIISGFTVHTATSLHAARVEYNKQPMGLIILDVTLPDGESFDLARELRCDSNCPPIIYITSHTDIDDIRKGFETGCQDYIKKPFVMEELGLRVQRILGGFKASQDQDRQIGAYKFNPFTQTLKYGNEFVILARLQTVILDELSAKMGVVVPKKDLLEKYWEGVTYFSSRNLDSVIVKLRERFKKDPSVRFLALKREGYRLVIIEKSN